LIAVSKRWAIATAVAMAALRTTALGDVGGNSSEEDGCRNSRGKYNGSGNNGVLMITLVAFTITHFITRHVVTNVIACVVAIAIAFVSMRQRGQWQGPARAMLMATR
jgi:hypothetical protein